MDSEVRRIGAVPAGELPSGPLLEFRALGPIQVLAGGRELPLQGKLQRGLLAVLLLHANRIVSAEHLIEALWGLTPPKTARPGLQWQVSRLRKLLDRPQPGSRRLTFHAPGYVLTVHPGELDLERFPQLVEQGRGALAADDILRASQTLAVAVGLWRGPAFEDAGVPGLVRTRSRWESYLAAALEDRVDADLRLGRHRELLGELDDLVARFPHRERLRALQMLALYRTGNPSAAVAAYRGGRAALADDLGLDPGGELQTLLRKVLARDPDLDPAPPGTAARVRTPAQLPPDVAGFTGRTREQRALSAARSGGGDEVPAVIALTGPAGAGKTALALRSAHRVAADFPDGQLYADLRAHATEHPLAADRVLAGFLRALGVAAHEVPGDLDEAASLYRSLLTGRRVLVLLDDVGDPEQVRPLFPGGRECLVLLTSRYRLGGLRARNGVQELTLGGLTPSESRELLMGILGTERVRGEADAAEELAASCAHLPLALRIAATRLSAGSHATIADFVRDLHGRPGLGALEVERDDHASMRLSFERSYQRLTTPQRRLFRCLAHVTPAAVTPRSAAAVTGTSEHSSARLLAGLADANMIASVAPDRYELHDLMRLYAIERAQREEESTGSAPGRTKRQYRFPERAST